MTSCYRAVRMGSLVTTARDELGWLVDHGWWTMVGGPRPPMFVLLMGKSAFLPLARHFQRRFRIHPTLLSQEIRAKDLGFDMFGVSNARLSVEALSTPCLGISFGSPCLAPWPRGFCSSSWAIAVPHSAGSCPRSGFDSPHCWAQNC